jgi:hypothetical protein
VSATLISIAELDMNFYVIIRMRLVTGVLHSLQFSTLTLNASEFILTISHPDMRVKHCAYGHSVATLLNPRYVTTVSHRYRPTDAKYATVVVAVPSTVHDTCNYKIKIYYLI